MAGEVYQVLGTPITFKSSGGSYLWTPTSLGAGAGRKSDQWDRGVSPQPDRFLWRAKIALAATPLIDGSTLDFYIAASDGTIIDGTTTGGDASFTDEDALKNMMFIGSLVVDTTGTDSIQGGGEFMMTERYGILVFWNGTVAETLSATATDHEFIVTPVYYQSQ